jgi:hypothetical protein
MKKRTSIAVAGSLAIVLLMPTPALAAPRFFDCAVGFWDPMGGTMGPYTLGMGQLVDVAVSNNNIFALTVSVDELFSGQTQSATIAQGSSTTFHFSAFGAEPIAYRFQLRTASTSVIARFDFFSTFCGKETGKITSDVSGKCLRKRSGNAVIWDCSKSNSWTWGNTTIVGGWDRTIRASGCLTATGTATGSKVVVSSCVSGSTSQRWEQQSDRTIMNLASGLCLGYADTTNGTLIKMRICDNTNPRQRWELPIATVPL